MPLDDGDLIPENSLFLEGWCTITTRLLNRGGSQAWHVIDDAMLRCGLDRGEGNVVVVNDELETLGLIRQLRPARTHSEAQTTELLQILQSHRITSQHASSTEEWKQLLAVPTTPLRGDHSVFLGQVLNEQPARSLGNCPHLSHLVKCIERTVQHYVTSVEFDLRATSVQLAEYPGDGVSGYPRHCDRDGNRCRNEPVEQEDASKAEPRARMITAVYYLTPDDWDSELDGGCLRLYTGGNTWYDVVPYSNRLVLFRSDGVEHQVLPSHRRPRRALTVWLYGRLKVQPSTEGRQSQARPATPIRLQIAPSSTLNHRAAPPPLPIDEEEMMDTNSTIFVMIPAYRDTETGPTIRSLMGTARHSARVYVGLVLQVDTLEDQDRVVLELLPSEQAWYTSHVRVLTLDARHANGPCPARRLCQSLHRGEDYVLGIDAHMRFRSNWDVYLIQQLHRCSSGKAVLSTYPTGYHLPNSIPNETRGTKLEPWKFDQDGMFRQKANYFAEPPTGPVLTHLFAAGFHFAKSTLLQECPYQDLAHLFFGEEASMAVRLFVSGYDLYAPTEAVCYHLWSRAHRPPPLIALSSSSSPIPSSQTQRHESRKLVHHQLTSNEAHSGLKTVRDVLAFGIAIGVDFASQRICNPNDGSRLEVAASSSEILN